MGGAKNCPETPRQKMIGMMYLVLTAMLALNVSSEVLNGFTMVDNSLHTTIESANFKNKLLYEEFEYQYNKNPQKVKEWLDKAKVVRSEADKLFDYIQTFKVEMIRLADKDKTDPEGKVILAQSNLDAAGQYAILQGNDKILKNNIESFKNILLTLAEGSPRKQELYKTILDTSNPPEKTWSASIFESMPLSAVAAVLTKYQSEVRAAEADIVEFLKSRTDASDFRVNKIEALVVPNSRHVIRGDRYSARIVLSATDSTKRPNFFINGAKIGDDGLYTVQTSKSGEYKFSGRIDILNNEGETQSYPFTSDYTVGDPTATISNEDLNVVYRGVDNRFSISVPGVANENVSVRAEGGNVKSSGGGKYIINPTRDGEIRILVFAKVDGKEMSMGAQEYRVKQLPDPQAFIVTSDNKYSKGGLMQLDELRNATMVATYGKDELIKANFRLTSFRMLADGIGVQQVNGNKFDQAFLNRLSRGRNLILTEIKAVGPDGVERELGSIVVRL